MLILKKLILLITITIAIGVNGQPKLPTPPDRIAIGLIDFTKQFRLDNIGESSGVLVSIYWSNNWEWSYSDGMNNIVCQTSTTPNLIFRAASISKLLCSTLILQLCEKKVLSLDDPINKWLDKTFVEQLPNGNRITIKDLLQHTSGLFEPQAGLSQGKNFLANPQKDYSEIILSIISGLPNRSLGYGQYFYSNANFNLLAEIVHKATGILYKDYVEQSIIQPLGLNDTYLDSLPKLRAFHGYIPSVFLPEVVRPNKDTLIDYSQANVSWAQGAADISSTTTDLIRFYYDLQNYKIITKEWVDLMTNDVSKYGLGTMVFKKNGIPYAIGHTGNGASHSNVLCKLNSNDIYLCFSFNRAWIDSKTMEKYLDGLITIIKNEESK